MHIRYVVIFCDPNTSRGPTNIQSPNALRHAQFTTKRISRTLTFSTKVNQGFTFHSLNQVSTWAENENIDNFEAGRRQLRPGEEKTFAAEVPIGEG